MKRLIKPKALNIGDTVATISLSWGGAAVFRKRYEQGVHQFKEAFGVNVIETSHSLASENDIYEHPEWRLADLMEAFENPEIKAILCNVGGDDTIRLLRHMNDKHFQTIHDNPKIFLGMSDTTINHLMCYKAGLESFYSPCTMFGYAENGGIPKFSAQHQSVLCQKVMSILLTKLNGEKSILCVPEQKALVGDTYREAKQFKGNCWVVALTV